MVAAFTKGISRAMRLSARLESGTEGIDCVSLLDKAVPFGGSKQSGIGRELGKNGLKSYTERKTIFVKYEAPIAFQSFQWTSI